MQTNINVAICQMEILPGHPDLNVEKMLREINRARKRKVDVIVFPEMVIPGYLLGDEWENDSFIRDCLSYNQDILSASRGICVVWGNVWADFQKKGEDGRTRKFNAAFIAQNGCFINNGIFEGYTFKSLLPKYREFDDERHFYSMIKLANEKEEKLSNLLKPFPITVGGKIFHLGIILCEDMWCDDYVFNPTHLLVQNGAEMIVNLSCSPWTWRKNNKRHRVVKSLLARDRVPFFYCNNVGIQNNGKNLFLFDGNSTVYHPDGSIGIVTTSYKEETVDFVLGKDKRDVKIENLSVEKDTEELYNGLIYGIRKFFEKLPSRKVVIGISGGIDSAVSSALLVEALGAQNVFAVNMPSKFNSNITRRGAAQMAQNLGINYAVFPIQTSVDQTVEQLSKLQFVNYQNKGIKIKLDVSNFVIENIQARDRGSRVLAGIAACLGAVFINNGNKTETALGYATLYGDVDGALAPLADLYKHEVYKLAKYINDRFDCELIPKSIIDVVPSAELSVNQDVSKNKGDPIFYSYHDNLVRAFVEFRKDPEFILGHFIDGSLEDELKIEKGILMKHFKTNEEFIADLEEKWRQFKINFFKRIQSPPVITVSKRGFGFDLREAQNGVHFTRKYFELKRTILPLF